MRPVRRFAPKSLSTKVRKAITVKQVVFFLAWLAVVALILQATPAPGTDSSRFSDRLFAIHEEVFFWHESMYISETWKPDWNWYIDINRKIDAFQTELDRLPNSDCARQARSIAQFSGPWLAYNPADIASIEAKWKVVIDQLPLTCGEF
jgi:hypothetical protein